MSKPQGVTASDEKYKRQLIFLSIAIMMSIATNSFVPGSIAVLYFAACWRRRYYQKKYTRGRGRFS